MTPTIQRSSTTREVATYTFTAAEVLEALRAAGKLPSSPLPQLFTVERTAQTVEAYVCVPGGGDWSNTNLGLDEHPLVVKVVTETSR